MSPRAAPSTGPASTTSAMSGGYTRGADGAIIGDTDKSTNFGGGDGFGATASPIPGPDVFSVETWFRTTTTSGGKIVGFGNANTGTSTNYDRHIYMEPDGRITFGIYNNGSYTATSPGALNDGQWHQAVGTMGPSGMSLYIDGKRVGTNGGTSTAQPYSGYWRIGGDSPWSGNAYFAGDIDDVAIYPTTIPLTTVQSHYTASGRTLNVPTRPTDAYGQAVWDASPTCTGAWVTPTARPRTPVRTSPTAPTRAATSRARPARSTGRPTRRSPSTAATASCRPTRSTATRGTTRWSRGSRPRRPAAARSSASAARRPGTSGCYDRHIYMDNDGRLTFGVWTGFTNTITTPTAVNDGQWHHVVATQSTTEGMKLYVDGALVGTNGQTDAQDYAGYWRVGGDNHWGCCSPFLAGTIDEAAVYSSVLSREHGGGTLPGGWRHVPNQPPTAAFTHTESDLTASVNGSGSTDADGTDRVVLVELR